MNLLPEVKGKNISVTQIQPIVLNWFKQAKGKGMSNLN